jgi:hypothetical protein
VVYRLRPCLSIRKPRVAHITICLSKVTIARDDLESIFAPVARIYGDALRALEDIPGVGPYGSKADDDRDGIRIWAESGLGCC